MHTKILLTALTSSVFSLASGAAIYGRTALDIFDPHIITPNNSTIWVVGSVETVTWDTSDAPGNISNRASVILKPAESLTPQFNLTSGFDLRAGIVDITVPDNISPGKYAIILFGDSGDVSQSFRIDAAYGSL